MSMKRDFGTTLGRLVNGGVKLTFAEHSLLCALVEALPAELRRIVELQFQQYNLVQREPDQRALNFYVKSFGFQAKSNFPLIEHKGVEAPLVRIKASFNSSSQDIHAVLTCVNGRAFQVTLDRRISFEEHLEQAKVISTVDAWRSNFATQ
jgi:hypothetical protein